MAMTKKHFEWTADFIAAETDKARAAVMLELAVTMFRKWGARFDTERFYRAVAQRSGDA